MARPRSDDKRNAILEAAVRVIVEQGLGAPTAGIAKEAGVANGSLFTYFETKAELFNQLFIALKSDMAAAALQGVRADAEPREQLSRMWRNWMDWATTSPEKRRVLAQLTLSGDITPASHAVVGAQMTRVVELLERVRTAGPMRKTSLHFVLAIMNSVAETTMDAVVANPGDAKALTGAGFDALWRMVAPQ